MNLKIGRREYKLTEKDRILFNGACYQLITRNNERSFWKPQSMVVSKTRMEKLIKSGEMILAKEKYKSTISGFTTEYDLYMINVDKEE